MDPLRMPTTLSRRPLRRLSGLIALGAVATAMVAVAPAGANTNTKPPVDKNGMQHCPGPTIKNPDGTTTTSWKPHNSTMTFTRPDTDKPETYKCNDGRWEAAIVSGDSGPRDGLVWSDALIEDGMLEDGAFDGGPLLVRVAFSDSALGR